MSSPTKEVRKAYYYRNRERLLKDTQLRYQKNKEHYLQYQKEYRKKNTQMLKEKNKAKRDLRLLQGIEFLGGCCSKCGGIFDPVCYDFHHLNPENKTFTIGEQMLVGKKRLFDEIKKCILVCSNCHRIIHKELRGVA